MSRTRSNIAIDGDHVRTVMARYGLRTKTEAVDLALRYLAAQPMSRDEAQAMRGSGAILERPPDTSSVELDEASLRA